MLEKNRQELSDVSNSFVQQANGDIHNYGLGFNDVKAICRDVVRQELAIVTREALETLNREISNFEKRFIEKLQQLEDSKVIEKLRSPKLQLILHSTIREYATSSNVETKEELIDLLIERLKVDENSPEIFLIDTAIEILPKINKKQCYFLGALTTRMQNVVNVINESSTARVFLQKQGKLYEGIDGITNLDIQYLKQNNCCTDIIGQSPYYNIIKILKNEYDLLFRAPCTVAKYDNYLTNYYIDREQKINDLLNKLQKLTEKKEEYNALNKEYERCRMNAKKNVNTEKEIKKKIENLYGIHREYDSVKRYYDDYKRDTLPDSTFLVYKDNDTNSVKLQFCSKKSLADAYGKDLSHACNELINDLFFPFSDYNIEQYLVALNQNWKKAFEVLKRPDILCIDLTPIGAYIGRRIITRVTGFPTRSIEEFYNE